MTGLRKPLCAAVTLLLTAVAGCGHTQGLHGSRTLYVGLTEYRLLPQSVLVTAGPLTVFAHNYGRLAHNLVISRSGQPTAATRAILPGQSAEITLTVTPGMYLMASTILSDQTLGEYGTLRVTR